MRIGLTYADVLLVPKRTPLASRSEAITKTMFTRNITLSIPLVSANMATVTEHKMAIALARHGGIGVIHQFGSIEDQVREIQLVKRSTSSIIERPLCGDYSITIREAITRMQTEGVTSLLIMKDGELAGIFTSRDYLFEKNWDRGVAEVMTPRGRLVTAPFGVSLEEAKHILHQHRIEKLPLLDTASGKVMGLITTQDIKKLEQWPQASRDTKGRLLVAAAIGVKDALERGEALVNAGADCLVLDIAHAHSDLVITRLRELKSRFSCDVMVGNIATAEAARDLIEAGADGLKVGIGPSPVCSTRLMAGAGVPQLTAIMDVAAVARSYGVPVTADGGAKHPGDVGKAIAAGASTLYSGSFFAGCDEAPGMIIMKEGKRYKKYHGSASYESSHKRKELEKGVVIKERFDTFVEGVSVLVDYKGPVADVIFGLIRGLQSSMSYCGARTVLEMHENAEFMQITAAGWEESKTHGNKTGD